MTVPSPGTKDIPDVTISPANLSMNVGNTKTYQIKSSVLGTFTNTRNNTTCMEFTQSGFSQIVIDGSYRKVNTNYGIEIRGKSPCARQTIVITFTPKDSSRYESVTRYVTVTVNR